MLRRACSRVQVVPFRRPEVLPNSPSMSSVSLMGLVSKEVRVTDLESGRKSTLAVSAMLVPTPPLPALPTQPSSTPCATVFLNFCDAHAYLARAHLAPGDHIFVSGLLSLNNTIKYSDMFTVCVRTFNYVQDGPHGGDIISSIDPGTLRALVADDASRWRAYFHSPSEWVDCRPFKQCMPSYPDFKHKYTGLGLWVTATSTPAWAKARLAQVSSSFSPSHGIFSSSSDGGNCVYGMPHNHECAEVAC